MEGMIDLAFLLFCSFNNCLFSLVCLRSAETGSIFIGVFFFRFIRK